MKTEKELERLTSLLEKIILVNGILIQLHGHPILIRLNAEIAKELKRSKK